LAGRLLQGFSAGMELGGVSVYLSEIATPERKGFYVSWQSASQQVVIVVAALIGVALNSKLSLQQMTQWGWRVPLLLGCLIIPILFFLRRSLEETEMFLARQHSPSQSEVLRSLAEHWRIVYIGTLMVTPTTATFYVIALAVRGMWLSFAATCGLIATLLAKVYTVPAWITARSLT